MDFDRLIARLEMVLNTPLPGQKAHRLMSPLPVDARRFDPKIPLNHRKSGVLLLFYPEKEGAFFPLIKRPEYVGFHSGQVALPGGKMELEDASIIQTALREAEEEVGIKQEEVKILGQLSDLYIPTSNFLVSPVIGFLDYRPNFVPEAKEVSRIISADLPLLLHPDTRKQTVLDFGKNGKLTTPYFEIEGEIVWGATAMILSELIQLLDRH